MDNKRQGEQNLQWGKDAEEIAATYLIEKGYVIRERNWRIGNRIEIDLIAEKEGKIIFVEVKARKGDFILADEAVDSAKRKKMIKGGDIYLRSLPHLYEFRLDIISITGSPENYELIHIEDAFLPELT